MTKPFTFSLLYRIDDTAILHKSTVVSDIHRAILSRRLDAGGVISYIYLCAILSVAVIVINICKSGA